MLKLKYFILIFIYLLQTGCTYFNKDYILFNKNLKTSNKESFKTHPNHKFYYKIINQDRVSIIVYKHPELSTTSLLSTKDDIGIPIFENKISLPLIEEISIVGLTEREASLKIEGLYKKYLKYSKVRLEVLTKRVFIMGEINSPGQFNLRKESLSLLQLIIKAGDFKDSANKKKVMMIRSEDNGSINTKIIDFTNYNNIMFASKSLQPNDIIYIFPRNIDIINSQINSISPFFSLISNIMSPFIAYKAFTK